MVFDEHSSLLVETPTYSGALAALQPMGGRLVEVATDGDGLIPESLDTVMRSWDEAKQGPRPKVCADL
jgi:DNA-binding transcriptional MocR family regulator